MFRAVKATISPLRLKSTHTNTCRASGGGVCFRRPRRFFGSNDDNEEHSALILLRHGQSTWNATPTFTGWCDPPLTKRGRDEAIEAGRLLKARGFDKIDTAYTSTLCRAIDTCELTLEAAGCNSARVRKAHQLNERHYGALQGRRKDDAELIKDYGKEQLKRWRRDFSAVPPPMDEHHEHYLPPPAPLTESLEHCQQRALDFWDSTIVPSLKPSKTVLVAAHSNTIRALVAHLDRVPSEQVPNIHIPNSVPCLFKFDKDGNSVLPLLENAAGGTRGHWLFSADNVERLRGKLGGTSSFIHSIFVAWDTNGDGVLSREEIKTGLRQLMRSPDIPVGFIAAKIMEEIDMDRQAVLNPDEFQEFASSAFRKYVPGFLDGALERGEAKEEQSAA